MTDDLVEAELFGYARGAFTGADQPGPACSRSATAARCSSTKSAELSPRAQAKLLRVLQEREVRRVGEHLRRPVDVRVVAATNLPLAQAVGAGKFREDLLFRLAVVRIRVPPLRDRIEDIPLLAHAFWRSLRQTPRNGPCSDLTRVAALCSPSLAWQRARTAERRGRAGRGRAHERARQRETRRAGADGLCA